MDNMEYYIAKHNDVIIAISDKKKHLKKFIINTHEFNISTIDIVKIELDILSFYKYEKLLVIKTEEDEYTSEFDMYMIDKFISNRYTDLISSINNIIDLSIRLKDIDEEDYNKIKSIISIKHKYLYTKETENKDVKKSIRKEYEKKSSKLYKSIYDSADKLVSKLSLREYVQYINIYIEESLYMERYKSLLD